MIKRTLTLAFVLVFSLGLAYALDKDTKKTPAKKDIKKLSLKEQIALHIKNLGNDNFSALPFGSSPKLSSLSLLK